MMSECGQSSGGREKVSPVTANDNLPPGRYPLKDLGTHGLDARWASCRTIGCPRKISFGARQVLIQYLAIGIF